MHRAGRTQKSHTPSAANGKVTQRKKKTPGLLRYEQLLKQVEALNLPPMDTVAEEKRIRALEGF